MPASGPGLGEWEIPHVPLQYERAVPAGAVVRQKLRTTTATAVRGRAYDAVAHQQAAMPEQLLAPESADPEHDDQGPKADRGEAIYMTALRALPKSRRDVEALGLPADRLRRLQEAVTRAERVQAGRYTAQADADAVHPMRLDDQQVHRPQQPGPRRGREAGH
ncbi:hypothetical protein ACIQV2_09320 [Streptomyces globosus]|uniref:hypothetical protein n=1 Tax=Streptomyces globosus TaxID=68209 RepID=UPI003807A7A7